MKNLATIICILFVIACQTATEKAKATIHKAGEVAGRAGSEFAQGVASGVEKTFSNDVVFSEALHSSGVHAGKIVINSSDSATDNVITAYLIFDQTINRKITVKVFSEDGQEYGRSALDIKAAKDEAHYYDFNFDKRTNIDSKGKLVFE